MLLSSFSRVSSMRTAALHPVATPAARSTIRAAPLRAQVPMRVPVLRTRAAPTPFRRMSAAAPAAAANKAAAMTEHFCFQCEQTAEGTGCTTIGTCGKTPEVMAEQDVLMHGLKGMAQWLSRAAELGARDEAAEKWAMHMMFSTLTNVNFDSARFEEYLKEVSERIEAAKQLYVKAGGSANDLPAGQPGHWRFSGLDAIPDEARACGVLARKEALGDDANGLLSMTEFGLKGTAAYAAHANALGQWDPQVGRDVVYVLNQLTRTDLTVDDMLGLAMKVGEMNLRVMQLLDEGHTSTLGHPEPARVRTTPVAGKCLLVSGHDLHDLEAILKQTEGKGINVYTHGEMLPAHGYPQLRKYTHLIGNYGGAWQDQKLEFALFPGPIVMTSNCIIEPKKAYKDRIWTLNTVGWPGVKHVSNGDFSPVIAQALESQGFKTDQPAKYTMTGFGRNAVMGVADKVIAAVKEGHIKNFFLIGGCDGTEGERNYFKDLALATPKDSIILTLACGKYRFNKYDHGTVAGLPRMLDVGQCNDAYSAIQIAVALAGALETEVNKLPLHFAISWMEQKAVAVLLTLLHLNIKGIHLGPSPPAFVTPNMLNILVDKFALRLTGDARKDLDAMVAGKDYL